MRVLIVASEVPPVVSGMAQVTGMIARGLGSEGHEVDLVSAADYSRLVIGEYRLSGFAAGWRTLATRIPSYDVINLHGPSPTLSDAFLALYRTVPPHFRPPLVYTHHFDIDLPGLGPICRAYNWLHKKLAAVAQNVVVSTESYAEMWRDLGFDVTVVPWAVRELPGGSETQRSALGRTASKTTPLRVLFVGQMRSYKGVPTLLRAVGNEERIELTLAGDGPQLEAYESLAGQVCKSARFLGGVEDDKLARLYAENDVIVLPSVRRVEAFGLVLLEGMQLGCVPVASALPGVRDVAEPSGIVTPPGDVGALRDALIRLADDPSLLSELSAKSKAFSSTFTEERFTRSMQEILRGVAKERKESVLEEPLPVGSNSWRAPSLAELSSAFGSSWASVVWLDPKSHRVHQIWSSTTASTSHNQKADIATRIAVHKVPTLIDQLGSQDDGLLQRSDVMSAIAAPIEVHNHLVGVVCLSRGGQVGLQPYTEHDAFVLGRALGPESEVWGS